MRPSEPQGFGNCLFLTGFEADEPGERSGVEQSIVSVVEVALKGQYQVVAADSTFPPQPLSRETIERLLEVPLVVANLTGLCPNVMYQMAVRQAFRLPVIAIAEEGTRLPSELASRPTVFFRQDKLESLNLDLEKSVEQTHRVDPSTEIESPVKRDLEKYLFERLDALGRAVSGSGLEPPEAAPSRPTKLRFVIEQQGDSKELDRRVGQALIAPGIRSYGLIPSPDGKWRLTVSVVDPDVTYEEIKALLEKVGITAETDLSWREQFGAEKMQWR